MAEDVAKLPRWAQAQIQALQSRLEVANEKIRELTGAVETRIRVDPYSDHIGGPRRFLNEWDVVRYKLPGGCIDVRLAVGDKLPYVSISAQTLVSDFIVKPRASNLIEVSFQ